MEGIEKQNKKDAKCNKKIHKKPLVTCWLTVQCEAAEAESDSKISVFSVWSYLRRDPPQPCHHDTMIGTKQYKSVSGHEMDPPSSF